MNHDDDIFGFNLPPLNVEVLETYQDERHNKPPRYAQANEMGRFASLASHSLLSNAPRLVMMAVLFFGVLTVGNIAIARSADDLREWRSYSLGGANTALIGLAFSAALGSWFIGGRRNA